MAKVPALGIVCAEETQRLAAGKFVFKRLDPFRPSTGSPFAAGGVVVVEG